VTDESVTTDSPQLENNESPAPVVEEAKEPEVLLGAKDESPAAEPEPFDPEKAEWPEGLELTDEHKTQLAALAGEHKISAGAMKALVDMHANILQGVSDRITDQVRSTWTETVTGWKTEVEKTYGKQLDTVLTKCEKVVDEFGGPELREAMMITGMGNHPAVCKFLTSVAEAIGEGKPVNAAGATKEANPLASLYPSMAKQE
jgi:hypothetical protein